MSDYYKRHEEYRKMTDENLRKYEEKHKHCPKCGGKSHTSTLMGIIMDNTNPENYMDDNKVTCNECGWSGIKHDMVGET
jgi:hypothetical protein